MPRVILPALIACVLLLSSCQHLPDPKAFADSTVALRSAAQSSGEATVTELRRTKLGRPDEQAQLKTATDKLEAEWQKRNDALKALVAYADSLQEISNAGKSSGDAAKQLVANAQALATSLGIANPAGSAVALVSDTAQFIWSKLGEQKAARSLEESLSAINPAIFKIAAVLIRDLDNLEVILASAADLQRGELERRHELPLSYYKQLRRNRDTLLAELTSRLRATDRFGPALVSSPNAPTAEISAALASRDLAAAEVRKLDELLAATTPWHDAYVAEADAIDLREQTGLEIITSLRESLRAWPQAHADLLAAAQQRRAPTATELKDSVERLRDLAARYRALRKPASPPSEPASS